MCKKLAKIGETAAEMSSKSLKIRPMSFLDLLYFQDAFLHSTNSSRHGARYFIKNCLSRLVLKSLWLSLELVGDYQLKACAIPYPLRNKQA